MPEDNDLEQIVENLKEANEKQQSDIAMLNKKLKERSFSVQQFKSNDSDLEFYTGFCDYGTFQAFYNYLCPACERLRYIGSGNSCNSVNSKQWRSQPDNLVPLCKFQITIIIHFFRN